MTVRENLVHWLQEAYAMEEKLITMLGKQASDLAEEYPMVAEQLTMHQEETQQHCERVKQCLEKLEESPSDVLASTSKMGAMIEGMVMGMKEDKVIHYAEAGFAVEHFEIAHYRTIQVAAEEAGEESIVTMCEEILEEEQRMADWIEDHAASTVKEYLEKSEE